MSIQAIGTPAQAALAAQMSGKSASAPAVALQPASPPAEIAATTTLSGGKDRQQVEGAMQAVQKFVQPIANNLEFSIDDDTGKTVVKVMDTATKEVIRQIPSEEILEIARALDRLQGLFLRQKA
ncbi:MAG: flagellar protein FlaG [Betaproteobacteria bacterium]